MERLTSVRNRPAKRLISGSTDAKLSHLEGESIEFAKTAFWCDLWTGGVVDLKRCFTVNPNL